MGGETAVMRTLASTILLAAGLLTAAPAQSTAEEAQRYAEAGQWPQAEQAWRAVEADSGLTPGQLDAAVEASSRLNHWDRVVEILEGFRKRHPLSAAQRVTLYEAQLKAGRQEDAESELLALSRDHPADERFAHLLAFLYLSRQRYGEAVRTYRQFLQRVPGAVESRVNLALVLFKLGQGEPALEQLSLAFGRDFEAANQYFYRQLVRNMPAEGLAGLAEDVKRELELPLDGARAHLLLAREYDNLKRYEPAIEHYRRYLQAAGEDREVLLALAKLQFRVGRDAASEQSLLPLLEAPGETGDQARLLAAELAIRSGRFERAGQLLEELPTHFRERPLYQYFSARVALHRGEKEQARVLLEEVIRRDPELAEPYFHLAQLYLRSGRMEEGRRLMQEFQKRQQ